MYWVDVIHGVILIPVATFCICGDVGPVKKSKYSPVACVFLSAVNSLFSACETKEPWLE